MKLLYKPFPVVAFEVQGPFLPLRASKGSCKGRIFGRDCDKSLKSYPPCYSQSLLPTDFTPPPPLSKRCLKLFCNVNIVYRILKSQDYAQKAETSTKLCVHEFGFWRNISTKFILHRKWSPCTPPPPQRGQNWPFRILFYWHFHLRKVRKDLLMMLGNYFDPKLLNHYSCCF